MFATLLAHQAHCAPFGDKFAESACERDARMSTEAAAKGAEREDGVAAASAGLRRSCFNGAKPQRADALRLPYSIGPPGVR
jgi:hypothetical protein